MPDLAAFYPLLKPWLFRLDAELAHTLTVKSMVVAHKLGLLTPPAGGPAVPVSCLGL